MNLFNSFWKDLTWWKLVILQVVGVFIGFLIIGLNINQSILLLEGHLNDDIVGWIWILSLILPAFIGWKKKITKWWIPTLSMLIPLVASLVGYIVLMLKKYGII